MEVEAQQPRPKRSRPLVVGIILLSLALVGALVALAFFLFQIRDATSLIEDQERELQEQERELEEQRELIDKKETFGAAMEELLSTARDFDGVLMASLVPMPRYESFAQRAWVHRWDAASLDSDIATVRTAADELGEVLAAANVEASTNATGSAYESITDELGRGFVTSVIVDADALCEDDVLACVLSDDPLTVHFDAADSTQPYMTDWLRTGIAYHEFAHVLQFTNPEPTDTALEAFGGDPETMADCFALTFLDGWTLDHRVWVSDFEYWDVSIGYDYACNADQAQAVRDWYSQLGFTPGTISQR